MELLDLFDSQVRTSNPNWATIRRVATASQTSLLGQEIAIAATIARFCSAMQAVAFVDGVALLRQLIRIRGGFQISVEIWSHLRKRAEECGIVGLQEEDVVDLSVRPWQSTWLDDTDIIDIFERRSNNPPSLGDGMLNAMRSNWTHYRSEAQKAAVDAWLFAPPGSTTLVTLPTGGGKSLCTNLPAWFDSRGGRVNSGTTLVVVPTVALALDQQKQAASFFKGSAEPISRTGINPLYERKDIEASIRDGSLPILFTSPESLLGTNLRKVCLDAAAEGLITRFVIDEAHLIETWGAGFRPEFQLLSTFRHQLLERSGNTLRTLLLSATVSNKSREILERLFSEPDKLITVQANRLRPEIGYWFDFAPTEQTRIHRVQEALRHLPRPLILYVTRPDQATAWKERLQSEGYHRVEMFTGKTLGDERLQLLDKWMSNQIDIMIGTSAFGLGVDKADIRAVVHATLPENIDRFYQEVGRGGRDGYSATSLLCTCPDDIDLAFSLNPKRITFEKAEPRWRAMFSAAKPGPSGDTRLINRDAVPAGKHRDAFDVDREWNEHVLLMLQRMGAITIIDMVATEPDEKNVSLSYLTVKVTDSRLIDDPEYFRAVFESARTRELEDSETNEILEIVKTYSKHISQNCLGRHLAEIYDDVQVACGGCANCRQDAQEAYGGETLEFQVSFPTTLAKHAKSIAPLAPAIKAKMGAWKSINVIWTGARNIQSLDTVVDILPPLARFGFQQLIIPDALFENAELGSKLVRDLAKQDEDYTFYPHRLIPISWMIDRERPPLLPLATVLVYPPDDRAADRVYRKIKAAHDNSVQFPACVNIVHNALHLASEGKPFVEHVDGLTESFGVLRALLLSANDK